MFTEELDQSRAVLHDLPLESIRFLALAITLVDFTSLGLNSSRKAGGHRSIEVSHALDVLGLLLPEVEPSIDADDRIGPVDLLPPFV